MSELNTPFYICDGYFNDDGIEIVDIEDRNGFYVLTCFMANAAEIRKRLNHNHEKLTQENKQLKARIAELENNHADMVKRNAVLRQRPDLPVDRLPAIWRYEEETNRLKARIAELEEANRLAGDYADMIMYHTDDGHAEHYVHQVQGVLLNALNETHMQSLVDLKVEAIDKMMTQITPTKRGNRVCFFMEDMFDYVKQLKARNDDLEQAEFCVVAGKYETIGMQHTENIKYSSYRKTLDEALTALESVNDYPFCRIEYKGWEMYANKQLKGEQS